jgi:hypothetical protein
MATGVTPQPDKVTGLAGQVELTHIDATDWVVSTSADNALATATKAADPMRCHYVVGYVAGFSGAVQKVASLKAGGATLLSIPIKDAGNGLVIFPRPIKFGRNQSVSLELPASGTAGILGYVALIGFSK